MAKQGWNEQKLDSRLWWRGNLAIDRITRLQTDAHHSKSGLTLGNYYILPREILYSATYEAILTVMLMDRV